MGYSDKIKQKRSSRKSFKVPRAVLIALVCLEIVLAIILFLSLAGKGILPDQAWGLYAGVLAGLIALGFISLIRKWSTVVMLFITGAVCATLIFSMNFSGAIINSVKKVTSQGQATVSTMHVAVLKSSDIESIEQLKGEQVGYVAGAGNQEISKVQSDIDSKVM